MFRFLKSRLRKTIESVSTQVKQKQGIFQTLRLISEFNDNSWWLSTCKYSIKVVHKRL